MEELYPLQFQPYYKEFIWGGRRLEKLGKHLPEGRSIGESWEVFDADVVRNGPLAGITLRDAVRRFGEQLVGKQVNPDFRFPLLLKLSTTELDLSIQVHPDDEQARVVEPDSGFTGKAEMVYILDTLPGGRIFYGFQEQLSRPTLEAYLRDKRSIAHLLNELEVKAGDVIYVPPGVVHAYGAGLTYYELQQNSDITFRLFDWNRLDAAGKPRELHIEKALKVLDYQATRDPRIEPVCIQEDYGRDCYLTACRHFLVERLEVSRTLRARPGGDSFHILCVISGSAGLRSTPSIENELQIGLGDVVLIPAALTEYAVEPRPRCEVLRSSVPELRRDVIDYLANRGIPAASIMSLGGGVPPKNDLVPLLDPSR